MTDELTTIQAALDRDGVYVAPGMARHVDAEELAQLKVDLARAEAQGTPTYVVVFPFHDGDAYGGLPEDLLSRLHDASGEPGLYVANREIYADGDYHLEVSQWDTLVEGDPDVTTEIATIGEQLHPDDLGAQLTTIAATVADGTLAADTAEAEALQEARWAAEEAALAEAQPADEPPPAPSTTQPTDAASGDDDGGIPDGLIVGAVLVALLLLAVVARRVRARRIGSDAPYALPASVLDRVRDAHDQQLHRRAHADVLALGEAIDAADLTLRGDQGSWQTALDHYDLARRLLGDRAIDDVDVLDSVGAVVLAQRGSGALRAARRGRAFEPPPTCFLNPLHGTASTRGSVEHAGGDRSVPLCQACRRALRAGERPDVLDVVRDGEPVHYFETDAEPWASTGFGALETDLVGRLHGRR